MKITLTPELIKNLPEPSNGKAREELCDTLTPGLYCEVRRGCAYGTYYLRYKNSAAKTCHRKISRTSELSLSQARKRAQTLKAEILLGADPVADRKAQKSVMTLEEFANEHYLPYAEKRKRSYRNDVSMLRLRILPVFGSTPLNKLSKKSIVAFHLALRENESLSPASADHHLKLLRAILNLAVSWDMLDKNVAAKLPLFKEDNTVEHYLSEEEKSKLIDVLNRHPNQSAAKLILLLMSTGARKSEGMHACWTDIDLESRVWRIPATNSKSKKADSIPLNETSVLILEAIEKVEGSPYVFNNPRTKTCFVNIDKIWRSVRDQAGLSKNFRLHDLRHTFASTLAKNGISLLVIQKLMRHADHSVTLRYSHLAQDHLLSASASACLPEPTEPKTPQS